MTAHTRNITLALVLAALGGCCAGCSDDIVTAYGQRSGPVGGDSVNGTAVLAKMFERAGHRVYSWGALSPQLDRADCIVWCPDDFSPPSARVRNWLEDWLEDEPNRTLIYVGRDFDAAPLYWQTIQPSAPQDQQVEVAQRLLDAKSHYQIERAIVVGDEDCDWFESRGAYRPRAVRTLQGDPDWLRGVDPAKLEIELNSRYQPADDAEVLLSSAGDMLVSRTAFGDSQLLVVVNGSFLLNLPLVNHEHRKLAGALVDAIGPPPQTVVFLESRTGGPPIRDEDPKADLPTGLEILVTPPYFWVFLHFAVVGVLFCLSRWPIFGVPRELPAAASGDFGRHVSALAELLRRSQDRAYALARLLHYRQTIGEK